jgi:hypothetical protein
MGDERIQPTTIDKELYEQFKTFVKDTHGHKRGHLKKELENALRDYMASDSGEEKLTRIESDVATAVAMLSEIQNDGGICPPTPSEDDTTRARQSSKPHPNQPRQDKLDYLLRRLIDENPVDLQSGSLPKSDFKDLIKTEYDFNQVTVEQYQNKLISRLDANEHPVHGITVAWGERYNEIVDELRDEADNKINDL